jgi:hypothetical protein
VGPAFACDSSGPVEVGPGETAISHMKKGGGQMYPHETPNLDLDSRVRTGHFPTPRFGREYWEFRITWFQMIKQKGGVQAL